MNRAKEILAGSKTNIETTKYTKKCINKALKEIETNDIDIEELKERIKNSALNDNLFLKEKNKYEDNENYNNDSDDLDENLDDDIEDDLDDETEELDDESYFDDENINDDVEEEK